MASVTLTGVVRVGLLHGSLGWRLGWLFLNRQGKSKHSELGLLALRSILGTQHPQIFLTVLLHTISFRNQRLQPYGGVIKSYEMHVFFQLLSCRYCDVNEEEKKSL